MKALTHKLAIPICIAIGVAGFFGGARERTAEADTAYQVTAETAYLVTHENPKPKPRKTKAKEEWKSIGDCRITEYCPCCNDPAGYESSSGKTLENGDAACSWLPIGTRIRVYGREYTIVDICGTDAIDLFIDSDECWCNRNEYQTVKIKEE